MEYTIETHILVHNLAKWKGRSYILKDLFREFFSTITSDLLGKNDKVKEMNIDVEYSKDYHNSMAVKLFVTKYQLNKLNETGNFMKIDWLLLNLNRRIADRLPMCAYHEFWVTNATTPYAKPYPGSKIHL